MCLPFTKKIMGEKLVALVAFLAILKDTFNNCGLCNGEGVRVLAYLLSNKC